MPTNLKITKRIPIRLLGTKTTIWVFGHLTGPSSDKKL